MHRIDLFKRLKLSFVFTCVCVVSLLLSVLFCVLWFINFRNSITEVDSALRSVLVLNEYNLTLPPILPDDDPDSFDEVNSLYSKTILFSVSKDGKIDYHKLQNSYPYLKEVEGVEEIVEKTIAEANSGEKTFSHNFRHYRIDSRAYADHTDYVFYDFSTERLLHFRSAFWYLIALLFAVVAVGILAYLLSERVLDPVKLSIKKGKDLISNASHELKTPLTIIKANLNVIQSEPNSTVKDNEKWLQTIEEQVERTNTLVLDMLELSRLDNDQHVRFTTVDLSALVTSQVLSVEALCFDKSIVMEERIDENVVVSGVNENLERLVLILLDNAIKYTPDDGKISVGLKKGKKTVALSVINTGDGIKKEDLRFVFERFYKGDRARTQETNKKSFGLGLAIAKTICDKHNGKIECFSEVGKYTEFRVTLKLKRDAGEHESSNSKSK